MEGAAYLSGTESLLNLNVVCSLSQALCGNLQFPRQMINEISVCSAPYTASKGPFALAFKFEISVTFYEIKCSNHRHPHNLPYFDNRLASSGNRGVGGRQFYCTPLGDCRRHVYPPPSSTLLMDYAQ